MNNNSKEEILLIKILKKYKNILSFIEDNKIEDSFNSIVCIKIDIESALEKLDPNLRSIIDKTYIDGYSIEKIANITGEKSRILYNYRKEAIDKMIKILGKEWFNFDV